MNCVNVTELKDFTICSEDFMVTFVKMFVKTCWVAHSDSEYCRVWKISFCERIKMQPFLFIGHFKRAKLMQYIDCTAPSIHCLLFPSRSTAQRRFCLLFFCSHIDLPEFADLEFSAVFSFCSDLEFFWTCVPHLYKVSCTQKRIAADIHHTTRIIHSSHSQQWQMTSAANRLICEVVQSRRRPLLGPSPGWKRLLALSHLRHY